VRECLTDVFEVLKQVRYCFSFAVRQDGLIEALPRFA
jgi:hypothetical protein